MQPLPPTLLGDGVVTQCGDSMHRRQAAQLDAHANCLAAFSRVKRSPRPRTLSPSPEHVLQGGRAFTGLSPALAGHAPTHVRWGCKPCDNASMRLSAVLVLSLLGPEHDRPHLLRGVL